MMNDDHCLRRVLGCSYTGSLELVSGRFCRGVPT